MRLSPLPVVTALGALLAAGVVSAEVDAPRPQPGGTLSSAHWTVLLAAPDPWLTAMGGSTPEAARTNVSAITLQGRVTADGATIDTSRTGWDLRHTPARGWLQTMTRTLVQADCAERTRFLAALLGVEFFEEELSWVFRPLRHAAFAPSSDTPLGVWEQETVTPTWTWPPAPAPALDRTATQHARLVSWDEERRVLVRVCDDTYHCGAAHGSLTCSMWRIDARTGAADAYEVPLVERVASDFTPVATPEGGDNEHRATLPISNNDEWNWIRTIWDVDGAPQVEAQVSWDSCYACSSSAWSSYTASQRARTTTWPSWAGERPVALPRPLATRIAADYPQHVVVGVIAPR